MGRSTVITPEKKAAVINLYQSGVKVKNRIAKELKMPSHQVDLCLKDIYTPKSSKAKQQKQEVPEGCFDVDKHFEQYII